MKKCKTMLLMCFLICGLMIGMKADAAIFYGSAKVSTKSETKLVISWGKTDTSVSKWDIYRATYSSKGKVGKYKKIATISGKKYSYTNKVKAGKRYAYKIKGYKLEKKKKTYYYVFDGSGYAGIDKGNWNKYIGDYTPTYIDLTMKWASGLKPAGYQIYRATVDAKGKTSKYKKIATIKGFSYRDKKVSMLKTYKYKVKPYRKIGKKTKYGAFSSVITRKAVRRYGQYDVEVIETKGDPCTEVTVKMTSIAGNGDLKIYREQGGMYEPTNILDDGHGVEVCYGKKSLSDSWMDLSNGNVIVLKSGESIYLKMEVTGPDFSYDKYASSTAYFYLLPAYYDGKYGHFGIEFYKNSGWSGENQEY